MICVTARFSGYLVLTGMVGALMMLGCGSESTFENAPIFESVDADEGECEHGGIIFRSGFDDNGDGTIDDLTEETILCHGAPGADGDRGADADDGGTSLMVTEVEPPGENCELGGIKIEVGLDRSGSGSLSSEEINATEYVCNHLCSTGLPLEVTLDTTALPAQFESGETYSVPVDADADVLAVEAVEAAGDFHIEVSYDVASDSIEFEHHTGMGIVDLALFITDGCDMTTKSIRLGPFE